MAVLQGHGASTLSRGVARLSHLLWTAIHLKFHSPDDALFVCVLWLLFEMDAADPGAERLRALEVERKAAKARSTELKRQIKREMRRKKILFAKTRGFTAAELYAAARRAEAAPIINDGGAH